MQFRKCLDFVRNLLNSSGTTVGTGKFFLLLARESVGEGGMSTRIDCWGESSCCSLKCDEVVGKVKHHLVQDLL